MELFSTTRSILGTIRFLHEENAELPAMLILIFSVSDTNAGPGNRRVRHTVNVLVCPDAPHCSLVRSVGISFVPIMKFVMLIMVGVWTSNYWRWHLFMFVRNWSKWSMADVFVTAIFVAYLSANAAPATMTAELGTGEQASNATRIVGDRCTRDACT
jgi:uncharacterized paraquat-inducible protein A